MTQPNPQGPVRVVPDDDECGTCGGAGEVLAQAIYGEDYLPCPACISREIAAAAPEVVEQAVGLALRHGLTSWMPDCIVGTSETRVAGLEAGTRAILAALSPVPLADGGL